MYGYENNQISGVRYQSIPQRIKRLKVQYHGSYSNYKSNLSTSYSLQHQKLNSCFETRSSGSYHYKIGGNGWRKLDYEGEKDGRNVGHGIGIKKYSKRQIYDVMQKQAKKYNGNYLNREPFSQKQFNVGCRKYGMIGEKLYNNYRLRNLVQESGSRYGKHTYGFDLYGKDRLQNCKKIRDSQSNRNFEAGRIYSNEQLSRLKFR